MKVEPRPAEENELPETVEETLKALLLGELKVKVDPLTGQILEPRPNQAAEDSP